MFDTSILQFVHEKLNTLVKWDLARFFHDDPYAIETTDTIARCVGRSDTVIQPELDELVLAGVLQRQQLPQAQVYRLADNPDMQTLLNEFVSACDDRDFRARAIQEVIERGG